MKDKIIDVNGWKYTFTKLGVVITNPDGQTVGKPVPLPEIPIGKRRGGWNWFTKG